MQESSEKEKKVMYQKLVTSEKRSKELSEKVNEMSMQLIDHDTNASTSVSITQKLEKDLTER